MTNNFGLAHIHATGPNTDRDFIIQVGILPLDGKNRPVIQRFRPECSLSRSAQSRSGLKDKDLKNEPLFGTSAVDWKQILSGYSTLFVMKTGNGDEAEWIKKILSDHDIHTHIVDLTRIIQFFLPVINGHSFEELYETFNKKSLRPGPGLMGESLKLGEKLLKEIVYLFSRTDTTFHKHLIDLVSILQDLPEFNAIHSLITSCKESGWLAEDLLAEPNKNHEGLVIQQAEGLDILSDIIPTEAENIKLSSSKNEEYTKVPVNAIGSFFESDFIKQNLPQYEKRDSQVSYAQKVGSTLNKPLHNYIEAPTGIGKSLGYLVPSALFLEKNPDKKVVIATSTKNLQDQVIEKDWPLIKKRFPDLKIAVLKGKSNYICISALARQFNHIFSGETTTAEKAAWLYLALFSHHTDGDLEKIPFQLKKWFVSLRDLIKDVQANLHCTKSLCIPSTCVYGQHLHSAEHAHIIITNHYKSVLMTEGILERTWAMVVDEAERFGDNVRQALSVNIDSWEIKRLFYRLRGNDKRRGFTQLIKDRIESLATGKGEKSQAATQVKDSVVGLVTSIELAERELNQFLIDIYPDKGYLPALMQNLPALRRSKTSLENGLKPTIQSLGAAIEYFKELQDDSVPLGKRFKQRCNTFCVLLEELQGRMKDFVQEFMSKYYVHHFKGYPEKSWTLVKMPVTIFATLNDSIYKYVSNMVFTSATLYINDNPHHFISDYGSNYAERAVEHSRMPQLFNYQEGVTCHIDTSVTPYNYRNPESMLLYRDDVNRAICSYTLATNGRTLVLFMSVEELNRCFDTVAPFFRSHDILPLRQNGSSLEEIREFNRNEYSVLFGVDRFWSGVDFPGPTLSQVIITKAPNPSLSDPLIAHQKLWDANFMEKTYPIYGRLRLRQGFGRLVRTMHDKGGVIILDSRYEYFPRFSYHLGDLPLQVSYTSDQEVIMRNVLGKAKLKTEFHERRIDPFFETQKYSFIDKKSIDQYKLSGIRHISMKRVPV